MKPFAALPLFALALLLPPVAPLARGQSAKFATLYSFSVPDANGINTDGYYPNGNLIQGSDGNFYGTTQKGGPYGKGTAFKITPGGTLIVLQRFGNNNGTYPLAGLVQASDGNFYGTTSQGGTHNKGTIFKLTASGQRTTLYNFAGGTSDGANPIVPLVEGSGGNFYGVTQNGGTYGGVVYRMTPSGQVTILHSLQSGKHPTFSPLTLGSDGNIYGTIYDGSNLFTGYFYRVTPAGVFDIFYSYMRETCKEALVEGAPGVFYSTASLEPDIPSLFKLTPDGEYTEVLSTNTLAQQGIDGIYGALLFANDGNLYGGAYTDSQRFIYSVNPNGSNLKIVYEDSNGATGDPTLPLIQGRNGSFYGTTIYGGNGYVGDGRSPDGYGTICNLAVPPTITSAANATGKVGQPFSYQISGSLVPTHYGALGLFGGLKVDAKMGTISGTPMAAGTRTLTLQATNTGGTGTGPLKLSITN